MKKHYCISLLCLLLFGHILGATKKVLFIGNSYTSRNKLAQMTADIARSMGDSLVFDCSTPDGYTLKRHSKNIETLSKIKSKPWDVVVLQEQSQLPSFPTDTVEKEFYPYGILLDSLIKQNYAKSNTMYFMTWGRKNGDNRNCLWWPEVCTYEKMDSLIASRYCTLAIKTQAMISPVGLVWKYLRIHFPSINLYNKDGSHPSVVGSYVAACCFYSLIFKKDPNSIPFNANINSADAQTIKAVVKKIVFQQQKIWLDPKLLQKNLLQIANNNQH